VAAEACKAISLGAWSFPEGAIAFTEVRAVPALCGLMRRWLSHGDVLLGALLALRRLLEEEASVANLMLVEGGLQLVRAALAAHPTLPKLQQDGAWAEQQLLAVAGGNVARSSTTSVEALEAEEATASTSSGPGRRGMAAALLERRAAASAKTGVVGTAMGWLLSGGAHGSWLGYGTGEPSASSSTPLAPSTSAPPPAPCPPMQPTVPRLDFRVVPQERNADARRLAAGSPENASAAAVHRAASESPAAADDDDATPQTPPAVRLQRRLEGQGPREEAMPVPRAAQESDEPFAAETAAQG